ncbi:MAG: phenylalanine--tRNA ligase subunit beta [Clostridia bacterium]|nr:phenylalanine--tRNA ligase subunit beta [Clostridia bacterium]
MYISMNWIKDFVDLDGIDVEKLIYQFTMSTAEVEGITKYGEDTSGVIVAQILSVENVENSKKLHKLIVDTGKEKLQVICGAPNVKVGAKVAFAQVGSKVGGQEISQAMLAGQISNGMCLSEKELGIGDDHSGIIILEDDVKLGENIKNIIPIDDVVFEVDNKSLTNRPDLWGHYGIAREIAALTGRKLKPLEIEDLTLYRDLEALQVGVEADDENPLCLRYSAMRVENVTQKISSWKVKVRLFYCGMRSINLLADMTNYIMLELGQPMHAFDEKKVSCVNVKTLKEDTDFITLDSQTRKLDKGTLMIWNEKEPVGIAGVMGGLASEITNDTTSLFLESANFDAVAIRKTASKLDLRTDAAARYEKTLDPELTELAIARFIKILKEEDKDICVTSSFTDVYIKKYDHITIHIDKDYIDRSIGKELSMEEIITTLTNLEYKISVDGKNIVIEVPTFRATKDVSQRADIIEEIARIHGYDNIEPKTNLWKIAPVQKDATRELEYSLKELLASKYGMSEVHSYVWYNTELNNELGIEVRDNLKIVNGIVRLDNILRHEMAPTMLYAIHKNLKYMPECKVFEVGRTFDYHFDGKEADEYKVLGIGLSSLNQSDKELVYEAKSMIDSIVKMNKNMSVTYQNMEQVTENFMHPINSFEIILNDEIFGYISVVHPKVKDRINPKASIVVAELKVDKLGEMLKNEIHYQEITKYQTVNFDLSLVIDKDMRYENIEKIVKESNLKYLLEYHLIDIYENEEKLKGKKNITVRFKLGSYDKTLTKEEIDGDRETLIQNFAVHSISITM